MSEIDSSYVVIMSGDQVVNTVPVDLSVIRLHSQQLCYVHVQNPHTSLRFYAKYPSRFQRTNIRYPGQIGLK